VTGKSEQVFSGTERSQSGNGLRPLAFTSALNAEQKTFLLTGQVVVGGIRSATA